MSALRLAAASLYLVPILLWLIMGWNVRRWTKRLPWLPETISQALDIMRDHIASESVGGVDIAIETAIPRPWARLFDFSHRAEVQRAGYVAAREALSQAREAVPGLRRAA